MELWGWLIGYVVLFALLHLVLYYVYVRRQDGGRSPRPSFADGNGPRPHRPSGADRVSTPPDDPDRGEDDDRFDRTGLPDDDEETVTCPHCGTVNESAQPFTYCWNCISTLRR